MPTYHEVSLSRFERLFLTPSHPWAYDSMIPTPETFMANAVAKMIRDSMCLWDVILAWNHWLHNSTGFTPQWARLHPTADALAEHLPLDPRFAFIKLDFLTDEQRDISIAFTHTQGEMPKPREHNKEFEEVVKCASYVFQTEHVTASFILLVDWNMMRLSRWDRTGVVYTERFDYTSADGRELLCEAMLSFTKLTREQFGYDPTAFLIKETDRDFHRMTELARYHPEDLSDEEGTEVTSEGPYVFHYVRKAFANSLQRAKRYRLIVPQKNGRTRTFLVGNPAFAAGNTIFSRGTKGYVAWDVDEEQFVWLKDAWRSDCYEVQSEGETLQLLCRDNVRGVPTYVCYADLDHFTEATIVEHLEALGDAELAKSGRRPFLSTSQDSTMRHYRFVVEEVCMELCNVKNGRELLSVTRDCIQAHADAAEKSKLLHRDISTGNVLMHPKVVCDRNGKLQVTRRGLLIDWELADWIDKPTPETKWYRRGTYKYLSIHLSDCNFPFPPSRTADDLEAFFHFLLCAAIRLLKTDCKDILAYEQEYYAFPKPHEKGCSILKRDCISLGAFDGVNVHDIFEDAREPFRFLDDHSGYAHPINQVLVSFAHMARLRYLKDVERNDLQRFATWLRKFAVAGSERGLEDVDGWRDAFPHLLDSHDALLGLLDRALAWDNWPAQDKVAPGPKTCHAPAGAARSGAQELGDDAHDQQKDRDDPARAEVLDLAPHPVSISSGMDNSPLTPLRGTIQMQDRINSYTKPEPVRSTDRAAESSTTSVPLAMHVHVQARRPKRRHEDEVHEEARAPPAKRARRSRAGVPVAKRDAEGSGDKENAARRAKPARNTPRARGARLPQARTQTQMRYNLRSKK